MHKPLHTIASVRAGRTFRIKIMTDPHGGIPVLQIKDLKDRATLSAERLPRINSRGTKVTANVQPGDIVLPARGEYYNASILQGNESVVATSQLFVVHRTSTDVTSAYLSWYLNQAAAQQYFLTHRSGTSIPMLSKQSLGALPITVPPLATQHKIVSIQRCWELEQRLTKQLLNNREHMLNGIFQQLLEQ